MLYHHDGITLVPEFLEGIDKFSVVPLMKPDAWLIKDVKHIHELGSYLSGKPDSLALTARK